MASTPLANDTSPEVERLQIAHWREMPAVEKAAVVSGLSRTAKELAVAGIRHRHPNATPTEQFLRLAIVNLGFDLARRVYPEIERLADL